MQSVPNQPDLGEGAAAPPDDRSAPPAGPWSVQVEQALAGAATLCVQHGVDLDAWMKAAWTAYVEARPGLREELEDRRLAAELSNLRQAGRLAQA